MTDRDFDLLSAYIDKHLSPTEKSALESRLRHEDDLRATLKEMRSNQHLMRTLPLVKPPRRFTLTPAQARAMQRPAFFPALQFATAFAALCFVVVFTLDAFNPAATSSVAMAPERQAETVGNADPYAAKVAEGDTANQASGDAQSAAGASSFAAPPEVAQDVTNTMRIQPATDALSTTISLADLPTETPDPSLITIETYSAEVPSETASVLPYALPAPDESQPRISTAPAPNTETPWLRYASIGFAALTLLFALAAWWLNRR